MGVSSSRRGSASMKNEPSRYTGIPPVNRGDGVARKKNTGKQGKPVNWRLVNRDIDCILLSAVTMTITVLENYQLCGGTLAVH